MTAISDVMEQTNFKMNKTIEILRADLATVRAGRATPSLLEKVCVDYYGTPTPVSQVANITVPEPRMIVIQPWERTMLKDIEKAIMKSDLGLNPNNDGSVIRLNIPQLTEQRRQEIVKSVSKKVEDSKVAIRNIRRDANDCIKKLEKDKEIAQDESKKAQEDMQKLTDKYIKIADEIYQLKEKEILEV